MEGLLMTPTELSQRLHVSIRSLERMRSDGSGPPWIRVSAGRRRGRIAYPEAGLQTWIEQRTIPFAAANLTDA
jgi:hypothetical protein